MLELVVAHEPVPELVAGFVHGHAFRCRATGRREPARSTREQRGILHPARTALEGGIDDGDVPVGVGPPPLPVVAQGRAGGLEVTAVLAGVLALQEEPHLHGRQRRVLESGTVLDEVGAGRPGEVVHVVGVVGVGD